MAAFSLLEVVIATAVFATAIVAIIGLMTPLSRRVEDVIDSETAARLCEGIQTELRRVGYAAVSPLIESGTPIYLYASLDGRLVLWGPKPAPIGPEDTASNFAVNNDLVSGDPPGLAKRDRYFVITVVDAQPGGIAYDPANAGSVPLRATVSWPYRVPIGPPTPNAGDPSLDPSRLVSVQNQQQLDYFFALTP